MGRRAPVAIGWLIILGLPLAWCSSSNQRTSSSTSSYQAPSTYIAPAVTYETSSAEQVRQNSNSLLQSALPDGDPATPRSTVPATSANPSTSAEGILYTKSRVNMRAGPATTTDIVAKIDAGESVLAFGLQGKWYDVRYGHLNGWIHGDFLTKREPASSPDRGAPSAQRYSAFDDGDGDNSSGSGAPSREPYTGRCDCPYDLMKNGRACGGRSAYSKPGGRKPRCYD